MSRAAPQRARSAVALALLIASLAPARAQPTLLATDWAASGFVRANKVLPTLQVVTNPLLMRASPIHDQAFASLRALKAQLVRFVPWMPFPRLVINEFDRESGDKLCGFAAFPSGLEVTLNCSAGATTGDGGVIASVDFAAYGSSSGFCGNMTYGGCYLKNGTAVVEAKCLGKRSCTIVSDDKWWGASPGCEGGPNMMAVQVTCSDPTARHVYWNSSAPDEIIEDFMAAMGVAADGSASNATVVINYSTAPTFLYDVPPHNKYRTPVPDSLFDTDLSYQQGWCVPLEDPTAVEFGRYYGRVLAHLTQGGHVDQYGRFVPSRFKYNISHYECLNELEHHMTVQSYTQRYDAMWQQMSAAAPEGSRHMQWMAGGLRSGTNPSFWSYFLDAKNHVAGAPLEWISAHYYGGASDGNNESTYFSFFTGIDGAFVADVSETVKIRDQLAPSVKIDFNEVGIFVGGGGNQTNPNFPVSFWNAAGAQHAYMYIKSALLGIDALGMSQLVANPPLVDWPGCNCTIDDQYASVAILDWNTGLGTARYWVLKLLIDHVRQGDALQNTTATGPAVANLNGPPVAGQGFLSPGGAKTLLLLNKDGEPRGVTVPGATGATLLTVDLATGYGPPRQEVLATDTWTMAKFAVSVVLW